MKLLVDESLASRVAALLADAGHDAIHVGDRELLGAPDEMVLATARREDRVVVTADTDFGTLLVLSTPPQPSVILLRRPGRRADQRARAIIDVIDAVGEASTSVPWWSLNRIGFECGRFRSTRHEPTLVCAIRRPATCAAQAGIRCPLCSGCPIPRAVCRPPLL